MLQNNMLFSITELSNLTGKTRPTLYKYIAAYDSGDFDSIPFSFIQLFNLMTKPNVQKAEIVSFCENNYVYVDKDEEVNEFVKFIKENKSKIDFKKLKQLIEEDINSGK